MSDDARTEIVETSALDGGPIQEASQSGSSMLVQLINPGWGSSGYYSAEVLEAAAGARVWPAGTHMYLDHPSATEEMDRPERSVRDLAAVLTEDARWDGVGLVASARVFGPYREHLADMADAIGVSIRATATAERGEAEGRQGPIITELHEGISVDFVTHAGRGGKVLQVLESAQAIAEQLPGGHTVDSLRGALRSALQDTHGGDSAFVFVRDFTDEVAYFDVDTEDGSTTYQQAYTADDNGAVQMQDGPTKVQPRIQYVPVEASEADEPDHTTDPPDAGPGETPAAESAADTSTEEADMDGTTGAGGALTPRQVIESQLAETRRQVAEMQARERARSVIGEVLADAWVSDATKNRLTEEQLRDLPLVEDQLDESALRDRVLGARDRAEAEAAETLQAAGMGQPRALGQSTPQGGDVTNLDERLESAFRGMGLGESIAKTAAKGR